MYALKRFLLSALVVAAICPLAAVAEDSEGIEQASGEDLAVAVGHYARARSLLIAALREFDAGYKLANPNVLLDSAQWRASVVDRASDLDRVLAPQPRASSRGMKFEANSHLLNEAKQ